MTVAVDIVRDVGTGVTTVRLDGELTFASAPKVRTALDECASECPVAVIADLTGLAVAGPVLLAVFPAAAHRAAAQWGVPVLLSGVRPDVARMISAFRSFTDVHETHDDALAAVRRGSPRWRHHRFPPSPGSVAQARRLVAQACLDWDLPGLKMRATLITSELASNAIQHAGSDFEVTVNHLGRYLRISVQDGSATLPPRVTALPGDPGADVPGRGLYIVEAVATAWNAVPNAAGKRVWALLLADPEGADDWPPEDRDRPDVAGMVPAATATGGSPPLPEALSDREAEVLRFLPTMLTSGDVAGELHISVNTVKAHMRSIYRKLGVSRRRDAVSVAYEQGLLP